MSGQKVIKIVQELSSVYDDFDNRLEQFHQPRIQNLIEIFEKNYKQKPQYISRAPGRVNLIGEHIDYMGYGVFPFAIEVDALIAFSINQSGKINIRHEDPSQYPDRQVDSNPQFQINDNNFKYTNYLLAGYRSVCDLLQNIDFSQLGVDLVVTGNVPLASGLSSSSALTVCGAVMACQVFNQDLFQNEFIENIIKFERQLGTACGGMDQTTSILGEKSKALYIQFHPIRAEKIDLPKGIAFVICNSLTSSEKLTTLGTRYNKRVCECLFAIKLLLKEEMFSSLSEEKKNSIGTMAQLQESIGLSFETLEDFLKQKVEATKDVIFDVETLEKMLNQPLKELIHNVPYFQVVLDSNKDYHPWKRALHVFSESNRVIKFKQICQNDDQEKIQKLGQLMYQSHESCKNLYDCSSKELDQLVELSCKYGALGGRLTGAGWGGCSVFMVHEDQASQFVKNMQKEFYEGKDLNGQKIEEVIFITKPSSGALIIQL